MDLYDVLGVSRGATPEEVRRAYRRQAVNLHPDRNSAPDAEERFKRLGEAYEVLSDPKRRAFYDRFGEAWKEAEAMSNSEQGGRPDGEPWGGGFRAGSGWQSRMDRAEVEELIRSIFGAEFGSSGDGPGFGAGAGSAGGARQARGRGGGYWSASFGERGLPGRPDPDFELTLTLRDALRGGVHTFRFGDGGEAQTEDVRLPEGIPDGARLRAGGHRLRVHVAVPAGYAVRDHDLVRDLAVAPWEAVLGGSVEFTHADGRTLRVTLPRGTIGGREVRLRGLGFARPSGGRGDLILRVRVVVPSEPTAADEDGARTWRDRSRFRPER